MKQVDMEAILEDLRTSKNKKMVLDTDTYNEVDDQFAVAYAMTAEDIDVLAMTAAPFTNPRSVSPEDGMEKSYHELVAVRDMVDPGSKIPCYRGSRAYLVDRKTPQPSEAAEAIVRLAHETDGRLYVACIGCFTNVASALLLDPSIAEKIVVILVGFHQFGICCANEFNLRQDYNAGHVILECGVPTVILPAKHCTEALRTTAAEMMAYFGNGAAGKIGDYLISLLVREHGPVILEDGTCNPITRIIWDIASVAFLRNPDENCVTEIVDAHTLDDDKNWTPTNDGRKMIYVSAFRRDRVYTDFYTLLRRGIKR